MPPRNLETMTCHAGSDSDDVIIVQESCGSSPSFRAPNFPVLTFLSRRRNPQFNNRTTRAQNHLGAVDNFLCLYL
jgi:hypothetical protein